MRAKGREARLLLEKCRPVAPRRFDTQPVESLREMRAKGAGSLGALCRPVLGFDDRVDAR